MNNQNLQEAVSVCSDVLEECGFLQTAQLLKLITRFSDEMEPALIPVGDATYITMRLTCDTCT